jgi:molybdopterin-guanine dinucleotide biosynthesis protein A
VAIYQQRSGGVNGVSAGEPFMNLVVLAGGRSERMGYCKYGMHLAGIPLYVHSLRRLQSVCRRRLIVENAGLVDEREYAPGSLMVHDLIHGGGPLAGIHAGLLASDSWLNFVIAADMPFACPSLVAAMGKYAVEQKLDIVYPTIDGLLEPLFAVYSRRVAAAAVELLQAGHRSIRELFRDPRLNVGAIDRRFVVQYDDRLLSFFNVNTPDDLIMARLMMHVSEKSPQEERV